MHDFYRGRRLRRTPALRDMVRETVISRNDLSMLYFVAETGSPDMVKPIESMPGQNQLGMTALIERVSRAVDNGLVSCMLFGIPNEKDPVASQAYAANGVVQRAVRELKRKFPKLVVITDVCLCEYTSHGHCGVLREDGEVLNDPSLELLAKTALSHVEAGADIVAPSDMMDGRVAAIRAMLDDHGFEMTPIMSYAVKYASAYYGPFREAAESAPKSGDRKAYQMDPANWREALREAAADAAEGADFLMVKPAGPYLDILRLVRDMFDLPLAAYQVSGEYSLIKAAAKLGWVDEEAVVMESLVGIKRAGADLILTYFTEDVLSRLKG